MVIKDWIKKRSWLNKNLHIDPERDKDKEIYEIGYSLKLDRQLSKSNREFDDITEELFSQLYENLNEDDDDDDEFNIAKFTKFLLL